MSTEPDPESNWDICPVCIAHLHTLEAFPGIETMRDYHAAHKSWAVHKSWEARVSEPENGRLVIGWYDAEPDTLTTLSRYREALERIGGFTCDDAYDHATEIAAAALSHSTTDRNR